MKAFPVSAFYIGAAAALDQIAEQRIMRYFQEIPKNEKVDSSVSHCYFTAFVSS